MYWRIKAGEGEKKIAGKYNGLAKIIIQNVGGDLFQIRAVREEYAKDYYDCINEAKAEKNEKETIYIIMHSYLIMYVRMYRKNRQQSGIISAEG